MILCKKIVYCVSEFREELKAKLNTNGKDAAIEGKHFVLVQSADGQFQILDEKDDEDKTPQSTNKLPTKGFVRKKSQQRIGTEHKVGTVTTMSGSKAKVTTGTEAIIIKTATNKTTPGSGKQPTVIPLTKEQIDAVLRSLKVPVPVSKDNQQEVISKPVQEYYEEVTEDGVTKIQLADMKEVNEKTPIVTISESGTNVKHSDADLVIPVEKRIKLDFPSPASDGDMSPFTGQENGTVMRLKRKLDDIKPSPQRALHLTPEFNKESPTKKVKIEITPAGDATVLPQDAEHGMKVRTIDKSTIQTLHTSLKTGPSITRLTQSPGSKTLGVQLSNQPATVFHVPVVNIQGSQQLTQPVTAVNQQVIHTPGTPGSNLIIPGTFSPPLTPNSAPASPRIFSLSNGQQSSSNITLTNVHLVQPSVINVQSSGAVTSLIRPIATKPTLSPNQGTQILPPQLVTQTSIPTILNKTPGGFVPITSSISNISKVIIAPNSDSGETAARQIAFDDVPACI